MTWLGLSPEDELHWVRETEQARKRAAAAAAAWSEADVAAARNIARAAPWMRPGIALALVKSRASAEAIYTAARGEAARFAQLPNKPRGSLVRPDEMLPGNRRLLSEARRDAAHSANVAGADNPALRRAWAVAEEAGIMAGPGVLDMGDVDFTGQSDDDPEVAARAQAIRSLFDAGMDRVPAVRNGDPVWIARAGELTARQAEEWKGQGAPVTHGLPEGFMWSRRNPELDRQPEPGGVVGALASIPGRIEGAIPDPFGVRGDQTSLELGEALESRRLPNPLGLQRSAGAPGTPRELVQGLGIIANAPVQEFQGMVRNAYGAATGRDVNWWEPQSDLLIMQQTDMEPGDGLTVDPDSELAQERLRREAERGQIGGHNVTLGRWLASAVVDPNTQPYRIMSGLVDFGVQLADPVALGAGKTAKVRAAREVFEAGATEATARPQVIEHASALVRSGAMSPQAAVKAARESAARDAFRRLTERGGLVEGDYTNGLHGTSTEAWLTTEESGRRVLEAVAAESSPTAIWRATGRRLTPAESTALADASTTDAVRDVLRPMLGTTFRTTGEIGSALPVTRRLDKGLWRDPRPVLAARKPTFWSAMAPHRVIDLEDPKAAMTQMERWMGSAHIPDDVQVGYLDRLARSRTRNQTFDVIEDVMAETEGVLARAGVSRQRRRELTRLFRESSARQQQWFLDESGDNVSVWHDVAVGDDTLDGLGPHLLNEHIQRFVPLPDHRAVRALTSRFPNLLTHKGPGTGPWFNRGSWGVGDKAGELRSVPTALQWLQDEVWKPVTLLRAAWPVRVVGEEQLRMAAAGLHSMFAHPASYLSWAIGRRGASDVIGSPFDEADDFVRAMSRRERAGGWLDERPGRVRTGRYTTYQKGDDFFTEAWADELATLRTDPVAREVARRGLDDAEEWFTNGSGVGFLNELADAHPALARGIGRQVPAESPSPGVMTARQYLETVMHRIDVKTGGNTELIDFVGTGSFRGHRGLVDDIRPSPELKAGLRQLEDAAPDIVKGPELGHLQAQKDNGWRGMVDTLFGALMGRTTDYLSRSVTFREAYWNRVPELVSFGNAETKAAILDAASKAGLSKGALKRIRGVEARGQLNLDEVDVLAKGHALDETKRLLYDLSERSQIADAMRLVFPFGEAWREVVTRWAGLANPLSPRGPYNLRRGQQAMQGLRGEDFGAVMGAPEIYNPETGEMEQQGFFWTNEFGEDVFVYPGSQWITQHAGTIAGPGGAAVMDHLGFGPGVPVPLVGSVQGLNMIGGIFPGVGPVAAIPTAWFLNDQPDLREMVLPFGAVGDEGDPTAVGQLLNYAPAWMRKAVTGLTGGGFDQSSNRTYANSVMSVANYLYSTGRYDTSTTAGQARLLEDARDSARTYYLISSLAAFGAPSAPSPDWLIHSDKGVVRLAMLRDDLYRMRAEDFATADQRFLEKWGNPEVELNENPVALVLTPYTGSTTRGLEATEEFEDWRAGHGDLVTALPNVWGFFAPRGGDFDYGAYTAQIARGDREARSEREWLQLSQNQLGWMLMDRARSNMPIDPTDEDRAWLRDIEARIREEYPGFGDVPGVEQRADEETVYVELARAVEDDTVRKTEAGKGLALYWEARQSALDSARDQGYAGIGRAKVLEVDREWLYDIGERVADEYPGFSRLWVQFLSREVEPAE